LYKNKIKSCLLTFDIEEWFQVENLRTAFPKNNWKNQRSSVVKNTNRILEILERYNIKATFFILGLVAKNNPELVKTISRQGHEIASHGTGHDLTYALNENQLFDDISDSKKLLEDILGKKIYGYRAPNFSVNDTLINILKKLNFNYDSSYNPFQLNKRYGKIEVDSSCKNGIFHLNDNFFEIPLSTLTIFNQHIPMAGGAYFRIFPSIIFKNLLKAKLNKDNLYHFYLHPWEFEPEQTRIKNIKLNYRIRHYTGLKNTEKKFEKMILYLNKLNCHFFTITEYLNQYKNNTIIPS
jgi:polysaccharide deacetylase family protein (PEP-CTERM system associated)